MPSETTASAPWGATQYRFTQPALQCTAFSNSSLPAEGYKTGNRISNGWYQLPGDTQYYGLDGKGSALIGALGGVGALQDIDSGCGPTGKAVYDAAAIADPEIDYDAYDTDKDGVVDFFMMVFAGLGGNGDSQLNGALRQHLAALVRPPERLHGRQRREGLRLRRPVARPRGPAAVLDRRGSRTAKTTNDTGIPVYMRVGPYNVNPESAIEHASVISHEYGHSLGLPDYYSTGSRETYGQWTLMATDYSQNIDVIGKKELGWLVPRVLEPGAAGRGQLARHQARHGRIDWKRPDGTPYMLSGEGVHNGEAYVATLPGRQILDPSLVPSGTHLWWSGSGNDFGCPPDAGHNLDLALPAVPAGTQKLTLTFKSRWDIEWDFDYGFVLSTHRQRQDLQVVSRRPRATRPTAAQNPNANGCQSSTATASRARAAPTRPARRPSTARGHLPGGAVRRRRVRHHRPDRQAGRRAALRLRHRPGAGAAGLVHGRRRDQGRRQGHLLVGLRARGRRGAVQRRLPRDARHRAALHERLAATSPPTRTPRPSTRTCWRCATAPASTPTARASPIAATSRSPPASCSPTPTRTTATATSAPTTRRRRRRWTRGRSRAATRRTSTTRRSRPVTRSATSAPATPTTTRTRTAIRGCSSTAAWRSRSTAWPARASGRRCAGAYDLAGDVKFTTTATCGSFDYGNGARRRRPAGAAAGHAADAGAQAERGRSAGRGTAGRHGHDDEEGGRVQGARPGRAGRCARSARVPDVRGHSR